MRSIALAFATSALLGGCTKTPEPDPDEHAVAEDRGNQAAPALSEEDLKLIAADPKTLTPELRRKRAHALRRKVMQNPDSAAARTLVDLQKAHERGELDPHGQKPSMPTFSIDADPSKRAPSEGPGPAGARPSSE